MEKTSAVRQKQAFDQKKKQAASDRTKLYRKKYVLNREKNQSLTEKKTRLIRSVNNVIRQKSKFDETKICSTGQKQIRLVYKQFSTKAQSKVEWDTP